MSVSDEICLNWIFSFAYVDLENNDDLDAALALNGEDFKGKDIKIEKAKPRGIKKDFGGGGGDGDRGDKRREWEDKRSKRGEDNLGILGM